MLICKQEVLFSINSHSTYVYKTHHMCVYMYLSSSVGLSIRGDGLQLYLLFFLFLQRWLGVVMTLLWTGEPEESRTSSILAISPNSSSVSPLICISINTTLIQQRLAIRISITDNGCAIEQRNHCFPLRFLLRSIKVATKKETLNDLRHWQEDCLS